MIRAGQTIERTSVSTFTEAEQTFGAAMRDYPDCEIRLTRGCAVLASVGPRPRR